MTNKDYSDLVAAQREYFLLGYTRRESWWRSQLESLKALFRENHDELGDVLYAGLCSAAGRHPGVKVMAQFKERHLQKARGWWPFAATDFE